MMRSKTKNCTADLDRLILDLYSCTKFLINPMEDSTLPKQPEIHDTPSDNSYSHRSWCLPRPWGAGNRWDALQLRKRTNTHRFDFDPCLDVEPISWSSWLRIGWARLPTFPNVVYRAKESRRKLLQILQRDPKTCRNKRSIDTLRTMMDYKVWWAKTMLQTMDDTDSAQQRQTYHLSIFILASPHFPRPHLSASTAQQPYTPHLSIPSGKNVKIKNISLHLRAAALTPARSLGITSTRLSATPNPATPNLRALLCAPYLTARRLASPHPSAPPLSLSTARAYH